MYDYEAFETAIRESIVKSQGLGISITNCKFGVYVDKGVWKLGDRAECCALGAFLLGRCSRTPELARYVGDASDMLGTSEREIWEFIRGFDGAEPIGDRKGSPYYQLGDRIRVELGLAEKDEDE